MPAERADNRLAVCRHMVVLLEIGSTDCGPTGFLMDMHLHESLVPWGNHLVSVLLLKLAAQDLLTLNSRRRMVPHLAARWGHFRGSDAGSPTVGRRVRRALRRVNKPGSESPAIPYGG
ncbi:hypothetical protein STXM2123_4319 [Streptomyces sp. F-3]|nr:hypothetical protein STXM2123_4319 [Streptomyces sp. F-3]